MEYLPLLAAISLFFALRSLARLSTAFLGSGYKLLILLAGFALAAAAQPASQVGFPAFLRQLLQTFTAGSPNAWPVSLMLTLSTAWIFLLHGMQYPAKAGGRPWLLSLLTPEIKSQHSLSMGLFSLASLGLAAYWLFTGGNPGSSLHFLLLALLIQNCGAKTGYKPLNFLLFAGLTLIAFRKNDHSLWSLPLAISLSLLLFLFQRNLHGRHSGMQNQAATLDIIVAVSLIALTLGYQAGLPAPVAALLAGLASGLSGREIDSLKSRYKLATELAGDILAFSLGLLLYRQGPINGFQPASMLFALLPALILISCALRNAQSSGKEMPLRQQFVAQLPVQIPAWALAAYGLSMNILPAQTVWLICGLSLLSILAPGKNLLQNLNQRTTEKYPELRVLVGLADTGTSNALVALSACFSLAPLRPAQADKPPALHALCVADNEARHADAAKQAEDLLIRTVATASQAGIRVIPSFTTSETAGDGLVRSASELNVDAIITGWPNEARRNQHKVPVLEQVLSKTVNLVASIRNPEAFRACRKLFLVLPPGMESIAGFEQALLSSASLAAWSGVSSIEALSLAGASEKLQAAINQVLPGCSYQEVPAWQDMEELLSSKVARRSGVIIFGRRHQDKEWTPRLSQLPETLAGKLPGLGLLMLYPAIADRHMAEATETQAYDTQTEPLPALILSSRQSGRIMADMQEEALIDALHRLMASLFPGNRVLARKLAGEFFDSARKEPIELEPGIILLHAHVEGIKEPSVAIGSNRSGWKLVALQFPVNIVIILCSPLGASPQIHLEALTLIAQALKSRDFLDSLLESQALN